MERASRGWIRVTLAVRGTVIKRVAPRALAYAALGAAVALGARTLGLAIGVGPLVHSLLGIALGMLLVFRTNAAYDRYWEGRRRWSDIVAAARNLMRAAASYIDADPRLNTLVTAYVGALRHHLRGQSDPREARRLLRDEDQRALGSSVGEPLALATRMSARVREHVDAGALSPDAARDLERYVSQLVEHQSACERLASSPMPIAYAAQIRHLLVVYLATLPFALVDQLGWLVVPSMAVIAFGLIGIEEAGIEIEEPFGEDENDRALDEFCESVRRDGKLLAAIGAAPTRAPRRGAHSIAVQSTGSIAATQARTSSAPRVCWSDRPTSGIIAPTSVVSTRNTRMELSGSPGTRS